MAVKLDLIRARSYAESLRERQADNVGEAMTFMTYADTIDAMAAEIERLRAELHRHEVGQEALVRTLDQYLVDADVAGELLARLADGIEKWGAEGDGVPEWLFRPYREAVELTGKGYETP